MLVVDDLDKPITQALAARPEVKLIDYTGDAGICRLVA